jgi:predicted DNA-binding protein
MPAQTAKKAPPYGAIALRTAIIDELDRLAAKLGTTRDALAEKALLAAMEDIDDELFADEAMKEWEASDKKTFTSNEVREMLGLDR